MVLKPGFLVPQAKALDFVPKAKLVQLFERWQRMEVDPSGLNGARTS